MSPSRKSTWTTASSVPMIQEAVASLMGMTIGRIDPRYGDPSVAAPPWAAIEHLLTDAPLYWLVTVRRDGRPHAVPLVGVWLDGAFAFCTGAAEQKQRNLDANPHVAVTTGSMGANGWNRGKDVVVEGVAVRVTDEQTLRRLAGAWFAKYGDDWRFEVHDQEFVEVSTSGGGTERGARVYTVAPAKVLVFGDEHGQTAYRF